MPFNPNHILDHDLERYYLGMVKGEAETVAIEEHLLVCGDCIDRAKKSDHYVDLLRRGIIQGNYDLA
jgi:hypothetical protein